MPAARKSPAEQYNERSRRDGWQVTCYDHLAFASPALSNFAALWESVRQSRNLPARCDFTARLLGRNLRDLTFLDRQQALDGQRRYRFGFYGSRLASYTGELTHKFIDEVVPPNFVEVWQYGHDLALELATPLRFVSNVRSLPLEYLTTESLVAPFADADGAPAGTLLLAAFTPRVM